MKNYCLTFVFTFVNMILMDKIITKVSKNINLNKYNT